MSAALLINQIQAVIDRRYRRPPQFFGFSNVPPLPSLFVKEHFWSLKSHRKKLKEESELSRRFEMKTRHAIAITCAVLLMPGHALLFARQAQQANAQQTVKIPADQLDALVAPIALYPDQLLSQTLVA